MRSSRSALGLVAGSLLALAGGALAGPLDFGLPAGVLPPIVPDDNPPTTEKAALGQKLYFDTRLSGDGTVACATCHAPQTGFADPRHTATSAGVGGKLGARNSPTSMNAAFLSTQFWDGRAATLEEQALQPFLNPIEMAIPDAPALEKKVAGIAEYAPLFKAAFGDDKVTATRITQAIATFERTLLSVKAPIDRFLAGDKSAISEAAQRGWTLYNGKARCNNCHGYVESFPFFTDDGFHNIGVGIDVDFEKAARRVAAVSPEDAKKLDVLAIADKEASALGRFLVTRERKHIGAFKSSQLRNVALTAPYFHDGFAKTLEEVIDYYDKGGNPNPFLDGGMRPLNLTPQEKADLVELLKTFTSEDLDRFKGLTGTAAK